MSSLAPGQQQYWPNQSIAPCIVFGSACPRPCREIEGCVAFPSVLIILLPQEGQSITVTQFVLSRVLLHPYFFSFSLDVM